MDHAAASEAGARERAMQSHESCRFSGPRPADAAYGGIQSGGMTPLWLGAGRAQGATEAYG